MALAIAPCCALRLQESVEGCNTRPDRGEQLPWQSLAQKVPRELD